MDCFPLLADGGFEALHYFADRESGLRALVAIHSTKLGPALGGTRALATYRSEEAAVVDVLRLAKGMTCKAALAGLPHGGGKAVVMLPKGRFDRARLFDAFGRAVESLGGRYVTTEDSGTSPDDMEHVRAQTRHVVGLKATSGDPSPVTALGVARGMEAVCKHLFGGPELEGRRVTLLGVGHVGFALAGELHRRGARLFVSDINPQNLEAAVEAYGAVPLSDEELLSAEADVFSPCALGAILDDRTIPKLKVKAVAGAANNQLAEPRHGKVLADRGIVYAPDYAINAGGLINVAQEVAGYDRAKALERAGRVFDTIDELLTRSKETGERPEEVADRMVEEKLTR
ncbi:MAG: amino acid dehydrogenase [Myxococcales bacterium]|nr:amino acid dehydrogenase [Myxococcales bacterium]